jgi:hypothetical protein
MSATASLQQNLTRVGNDGEIQLAITLDLSVLDWSLERAVTLKGERAARVSWTAHLKDNPKTLSHRHLLPSYQILDLRPIAQAGDEMVKSQFLPYGAWRHGTAHGALEC